MEFMRSLWEREDLGVRPGLMFNIPYLAQLLGQVKSVAATPSRCPSPVLTTLPRLRLLLA
jgi:hypothetical protein